ncbi:MAG: PAS domain S-box protein [Methanoregula sp.]
MSETQWRIIILTTSCLILLFSLYSFLAGITTVFPNLYYFPVILLAYRYHKKGVLYSAVLGLAYLVMALYFQYTNFPEIIGAFLRFVSFVAVAIVIAFLSATLEQKQLAYRSISEFNEGIISNANVWLAVLDAEGTIIVWNKAAEEISGYSADEVIGKNIIWKLIYPNPDYRKKISRTIMTIIREHRYFENFDTTIQAKNGEIKTISWNTRAITDETGVLNRYVAIGIDITKRQLAEKALAESEQRFRRTFDTAKDGLLLLDKETGKISRVNPAIAEMLGYPAVDLVGKSLNEIGILKDREGFLDFREMLNETGFVFFADVPVESREGNHLDTEVYLVDRATQVQCNVRDITRRKQAEIELVRRNEELRAANEQLAAAEEELRHNYDELSRKEQSVRESLDIYQRFFQTSQDCVFITTNDGHWVDLNDAAVELFGYSGRDELMQVKIPDLYANPEDRSRHIRIIAEKGFTKEFPVDLRKKDGMVMHTLITSVTRHDTDGNVTGFQGTIRDITERRRTETALQLARNKLNLLNSVTFTDIQNAIFSLSGYLDLEKQVSRNEKIQQYHDKQTGIVRSITDSLKFASQYQNLGLKPPTWQSVTQAFLFGISHLEISGLSRKLDVEGLEIYADPLLEHVFFTLAENVLVHGKTATGIRFFYQKSPGGLTLVFEDNGSTIPEDMKEKIFERRYEEKKGLGLFLAREILGITGMTIKETGEAGKGARFEITVPEGAYRFAGTS